MVRNGIVTLIGNLIVRGFESADAAAQPAATAAAVKAEPGSPGAAAADDEKDGKPAGALLSSGTRDSLLQVLMERLIDVSAYTRGRVLQTWTQLFAYAHTSLRVGSCLLTSVFVCYRRHAVPKKLVPALMTAVVDRVFDKGAIVRKYAIQLLRAALEYNPYAQVLSSTRFESMLQMCETEIQKVIQQDAVQSLYSIVTL